MRKINFLMTGRVWATVLSFGVSVLVAGEAAMAQSGSKAMEDDMAKHKAAMMDVSKKMMSGANMMREAKKVVEEKKDPSKAQQMMTEGHKMTRQGEEMMAKTQEMGTKGGAMCADALKDSA